jgi:hypothetical protein
MALYSGSAPMRLALLIIVHGAVAEALAVIALYQQHAPVPSALSSLPGQSSSPSWPPSRTPWRSCAKRAKRTQPRTRNSAGTEEGYVWQARNQDAGPGTGERSRYERPARGPPRPPGRSPAAALRHADCPHPPRHDRRTRRRTRRQPRALKSRATRTTRPRACQAAMASPGNGHNWGTAEAIRRA